MSTEIEQICVSRGITRICHFTPSRNLAHIAAGRVGVLATTHLEADEQLILNPTDEVRFDGWTSHVCCSIQYPNAWYLSKAMARQDIFKDWVIIFIRPHYLWVDGTGFCQRNAAAGFGKRIGVGAASFVSLFDKRVDGAQNRVRSRTMSMLECCPTDDQAEVLVEDRIKMEDIISVGVRDEYQAERESLRLRLAGLVGLGNGFVVSPELFDPNALSMAIRQGRPPSEVLWQSS